MIAVRGPNKMVVADLRPCEQISKHLRILVAHLLGRLFIFYRPFLDLEAMLISPDREKYRATFLPAVTNGRIAEDSSVQVPDVRSRVNVKDGRHDASVVPNKPPLKLNH
jgi:hypothetical protein